MSIVEVRGLTYSYDDGTCALKGIDFSLEPGETVALMGPNGSGKTTFALHLNGILRGKGSVVIDGLPLNDSTLTTIRTRVGMVFQDADNQLFMPTVLEDVAFGPLAAGATPAEAERKARAAIERVGMTHAADKAPWHLSAGEKKRAAIAGTLAGDPKVLVLDEPTTFLDPPGKRELTQLLASLSQSCIVITHDTDFARRLATRAVFFREGLIAGEGTPDFIAEQFGW